MKKVQIFGVIYKCMIVNLLRLPKLRYIRDRCYLLKAMVKRHILPVTYWHIFDYDLQIINIADEDDP